MNESSHAYLARQKYTKAVVKVDVDKTRKMSTSVCAIVSQNAVGCYCIERLEYGDGWSSFVQLQFLSVAVYLVCLRYVRVLAIVSRLKLAIVAVLAYFEWIFEAERQR